MSISLTISFAVPGVAVSGLAVFRLAKSSHLPAVFRRRRHGAVEPQLTCATDGQLEVLQATYQAFRADGNWPIFDSIDRKLYREQGLSVAQIVATMPNELLVPVGQPGGHPRGSDELRLTLKGVSLCVDSADDVQHFISALRWMVEREAQYTPERDLVDQGMPVTTDELAEALELRSGSLALRRLIRLLGVERWGAQAETGSAADNWTCWVGTQVRDFRDVRTIDDYKASLAARRSEGQQV